MSLECLLDLSPNPPVPQDLYLKVCFPDPPAERCYIFGNMASTADGKIVVGAPGGTAKGVGGPTDQLLFRRVQKSCDAALIGSSTLRAGTVIYPPDKIRIVATRTGQVPLDNRFFTDAPSRAYVLAPRDLPGDVKRRLASETNLLLCGEGSVDLAAAMSRIKGDLGVNRLLVEGGASLNDQLIRAGLLDTLFLTIAPKIKGGAHLPTIVTGEGFPPGVSMPMRLVSVYRDGSELYLRYELSHG